MTTTIDIQPFVGGGGGGRRRKFNSNNNNNKNITASITCECKTCKEDAQLSLTINCCKEHAKSIIEAIEEIEEVEEGLNWVTKDNVPHKDMSL
jgi:hypothetical protein